MAVSKFTGTCRRLPLGQRVTRLEHVWATRMSLLIQDHSRGFTIMFRKRIAPVLNGLSKAILPD